MIAGPPHPVAPRRHAVESVNVRRPLWSNLLRAGRPSHQKVVPLRPECSELILQLRHLG